MTQTTNRTLQTLPAIQWRVGSTTSEPIERALAEEMAIGVCYDSQPYAVLMATPADLEDLALGFTITERVAKAADVLDIRIGEHADGLVVDLLLSTEGRERIDVSRSRNIEGRSSCGLCGVESLQQAIRPIARVKAGAKVRREAVQAALDALDEQQTLGRRTRATHAAAWANSTGRILAVREDVGRHNALDKLIGAATRAGHDPNDAMILVTSRCSYEMVEKTAIAGVGVLAAISAPTALAVRKAAAANLTLIALARADGHTVFTDDDRIID